MTREEETFFRETKGPVRLAAAAYSASSDLLRHRLLDGSDEAKAMVTKVLTVIDPCNMKDDGLENWMLDTRVHVGIVPVEQSSGPADRNTDLTPPERAWDLFFIYRGTQPYSVTNWITDFTFVQEPVDDYILRHNNIKIQKRMMVHRGFHRAIKRLHPRPRRSPSAYGDLPALRCGIGPATEPEEEGQLGDLKARISELKRSMQVFEVVSLHATRAGAQLPVVRPLKDKPRRIVCTGHSLGGALATLGAAWCKTTLCETKEYRGCDVQCITIGSPRVGNLLFAEAWDDLLRDGNWLGEWKSYRIVNALDVVPSVPFPVPYFIDYQHVGEPVYLQRIVEDWTVKVVPFLGKERRWTDSGLAIDHLQWHYTAAMDAAETTAVEMPSELKMKLREKRPLWWFHLFARDFKVKSLWDTLKRVLNVDLSLVEIFFLLILSWGIVIGSFLAMQAASWLGLLPVMIFLLPALSASFLFQCGLQVVFLPFRLLSWFLNKIFGYDLAELGFDHPRLGYKFGNLSLALLSALVMVVTYLSAWLGL